MSLTIGEQKCINCKDYHFKDKDFEEERLRKTEKRGSFKVEAHCNNCDAKMALIIYKDIPHNSLPTFNTKSMAIAYAHTENDEPCYDEDCWKCTGNGKGWWED